MEVYVFFTLMGLGYMASQSSSRKTNLFKKNVHSSPEDPVDVMNTHSSYNDNISKFAKLVETQHAEEMYNKTKQKHPNVISTNYRDSLQQKDKKETHNLYICVASY